MAWVRRAGSERADETTQIGAGPGLGGPAGRGMGLAPPTMYVVLCSSY